MARARKTLLQQVERTITKQKRGLTVQEVASRLDANPGTVGVYVNALKGQGIISEVGLQRTGLRGRPAILYGA